MLVGIINKENNDYYVYIDNKNGKNILRIVYVSCNGIHNLDKDETIKLISTTLASDLVYSHRENDYDVYIDEAGNKRYFKDKKENYNLLFNNNGKNAILYKSESTEDSRKVKNFVFKHKKCIVKVCLSVIILSIIVDGFLIYNYNKEDINEYTMEEIIIGKLSTEEINKMILTSNLSNSDKKLILSSNIIDDVVKCGLETDDEMFTSTDEMLRNYELYTKFNDIKIETYNPENTRFRDNSGYYTPTQPNVIHMSKNMSEEEYNNYFTHEFVHLLQIKSDLSYLTESCAELISTEYFNQELDGYKEEVKRVKVLMEIIGPDAIFNFNFKTNDKSLETKLKEYLPEEKVNKLFSLFRTDADDWKDIDKESDINKQIDDILSILYFNKTGLDIKDNEIINVIYGKENINDNIDNRIYFNRKNPNYNKRFRLEDIKKELNSITLDEICDRNIAISYSYYKISRISGDEVILSRQNVLWTKEIYEPINGVSIINKENKLTISKDGEEYSELKAIKNGLIVKKNLVCICDKDDHFDSIKGKFCDYVEVELKDNSYAKFKYNSISDTYDLVEHYINVENYYPSINELFSKDIYEETNNFNKSLIRG